MPMPIAAQMPPLKAPTVADQAKTSRQKCGIDAQPVKILRHAFIATIFLFVHRLATPGVFRTLSEKRV